jgi:hypothetical protein
MSENQLSKHLARILEDGLSSFFALSWVEQLEKAEAFFYDRCSTKSSKNISLMFKALADDEKQFLEEASDERKDFSNFVNRSGLGNYIDEQFQDLIYRLPYYFLFSHIVCSQTYFQIDNEARVELREIAGLTTATSRRDAFTELFNFLLREKITSGGDRVLFWNTPNRLYFLSIYNRYQIVIKNARKDLEIQLKSGKRESAAKREIIAKYLIPDGYSDLTFNEDDSPANLAMDWAKKAMHITQESSSIRRDVLPEARQEAKKYDASHKLVSVHNLNLNLAIRTTILSKGWKSEMRFPDFWKDKPAMLYFI